MNILINANVAKGGGLQVADSFIRELVNYPNHKFVVLLSPQLANYSDYSNTFFPDYIKIVHNHHRMSKWEVLTGRDLFRDSLIISESISVVFSVFGPEKWVPRVKHISGYAISHLIYTDSPYWSIIPKKKRIKQYLKDRLRKYFFDRTSNVYITENPDVSAKLKKLFPSKKVYTVTNYYNQIFDFKDKWDRKIELPKFDGVTLLTIAANYPHKNLNVIPKVCKYLKEHHPQFKFRFVVSLNYEQIKDSSEYKDKIICVGNVNINQCPYLYLQSDFLFLPTLLECFTASYPEAMVMKKPILTSDIGFAKQLCGDAAIYFNPIDIQSISESIIYLSSNKEKQLQLISNGEKRLLSFDNYHDRAKKYIEIIEENI